MSEEPAAAIRRGPDLPRRFYKTAEARTLPEGETILLDGRPALTPARRAFVLPGRALAEAVAAEWAAQREAIDPMTMPLTRLAAVAIDGAAQESEAVREDMVRYSGSDLICYRAGSPEGLAARQAAHWDPLVRWAEEALGARFVVTEGVMHAPQPPETAEAVRTVLKPLDPFRLAALHVMTTLTGSVVIALAVLFRKLDLDEAWAAGHVDEDWNVAEWGEDSEAAERRASRRADMGAAGRTLDLL